MNQFEAIFWDNDGVLVDTERLYFRATREILAGIDVELTENLYVDLFLKKSAGAWHLARDRGFDEEQVMRLRDERNALYEDYLRSDLEIIEGAQETLVRLHGRYPMGIVTSSRQRHFDIIHQSSGLLQYFDFVLAREDYGKSKPDPEPYLAAVARSGVAPERCVAVEDSLRGLIAAKAAGIACIMVPTDFTRTLDFSAADKVLGSVREVAEYFLE